MFCQTDKPGCQPYPMQNFSAHHAERAQVPFNLHQVLGIYANARSGRRVVRNQTQKVQVLDQLNKCYQLWAKHLETSNLWMRFTEASENLRMIGLFHFSKFNEADNCTCEFTGRVLTAPENAVPTILDITSHLNNSVEQR